MKNKSILLKQLLLTMLFMGTGIRVSGTTYISTASTTADWAGTYIDSYQINPGDVSQVKGDGAGLYTFVNGDTLQGFFMFTGGLTVPSGGSGLTLSVHGVVDGPLTFPSGGLLTLSSNLNLGQKATLVTSGGFTINGGSAPGSAIFLEGGKVNLSKACTVTNYLTIDGMNHSLSILNGGYFTGGSSLTLRNMNLLMENSTNALFQSSLPATLENVTLNASGNGSSVTLLGTSSTLTVSGNVRIDGFGQRIKVGGSITINKNSMLSVGPGVILTNIASISMADQTSVLHLDGCQFYTGNDADADPLTAGLSVTKGTLILDNKVKILNKNYGYTGAANTDMTKAFIIGGSGSSNYVDVLVQGGSYVMVDGCMEYLQS